MKNTNLRTILIGIGIGLSVLGVIAGFWLLFTWASNLWAEPDPPPPAAHCETTIDGTTAVLDLEQSRNASIIAGVAAQRGLAPRAVSIGLTTAFQESGIRNLDYGDRDSLGIFQQRPSQGWGSVDQIMDPYYSSGKFFDVMVKVPGWENSDIGEVAQEVQRSGFPDAYDQHVSTARILASSLSGQTPASWSCVISQYEGSDPDKLVSSLARAYGATAMVVYTPAQGDKPAEVKVSASSPEIAWSVGAFAQSWASETGVSEVMVGSYQWKASTKTLSGWTSQANNTGLPTEVLITFVVV
ncbi:MAG: hypothetical protein FWG15_04890 [Propionibacteriaceae bacterium]|nr:hypothetical protein [Propionibacteriaceae bacterium]